LQAVQATAQQLRWVSARGLTILSAAVSAQWAVPVKFTA
jgi:hypothetical protein